MARSNVAKILVDTLVSAGVKRIYGVVGDSLNGMTECLRKQDEIEPRTRCAVTREVAAFAAGAKSSPGQAVERVRRRSPCRQHAPHERPLRLTPEPRPVLAMAALMSPVGSVAAATSKRHGPTSSSRTAATTVSQSTTRARCRASSSSRSAARWSSEESRSSPFRATSPCWRRRRRARSCWPRSIRRCFPRVGSLDRLAALLDKGKKVTILAGAGCAGAHAELIATAGALQAPIVHALRGKEHVEYDNPFDVGMTGLLGFASGYYAVMDCDVLFVLGTDFPYTQFYPEKAVVAQIDIRGENLGRRGRLDLGLVGGVKETLAALLPLLSRKIDKTHLDHAVAHYGKARKSLDGSCDRRAGTQAHLGRDIPAGASSSHPCRTCPHRSTSRAGSRGACSSRASS